MRRWRISTLRWPSRPSTATDVSSTAGQAQFRSVLQGGQTERRPAARFCGASGLCLRSLCGLGPMAGLCGASARPSVGSLPSLCATSVKPLCGLCPTSMGHLGASVGSCWGIRLLCGLHGVSVGPLRSRCRAFGRCAPLLGGSEAAVGSLWQPCGASLVPMSGSLWGLCCASVGPLRGAARSLASGTPWDFAACFAFRVGQDPHAFGNPKSAWPWLPRHPPRTRSGDDRPTDRTVPQSVYGVSNSAELST